MKILNGNEHTTIVIQVGVDPLDATLIPSLKKIIGENGPPVSIVIDTGHYSAFWRSTSITEDGVELTLFYRNAMLAHPHRRRGIPALGRPRFIASYAE